MRNRRRRLTPLAVIVELHLVFLSFKVFCLCVCGCVCVYTRVYVRLCCSVCVRTCVCPLFFARRPSTHTLLHSDSFILSFSLFTSQLALTHGVTCDRFPIRRRMRFTLIPARSFYVKHVRLRENVA